VAAPAAAAAVLLLTALAAGVAVHATQPTPPPPPAPTANVLPPTVQSSVGTPFVVTGMRVTVLTAGVAAPPAAPPVPAGDRLRVVSVRYSGGGGSGIVSPYEWTVTDASGAAYQAVVDGIGGALGETDLGAGRTIEGQVGFVVPQAAQSLVLSFAAEQGDQIVEVPISPGT
jgi:hypothetical protein